MEYSTAAAYYRTKFEPYVPTRFLKGLFSLPFRVADCFTRPPKFLLQTIIRPDGAYKKRLIVAGAADSDASKAFEESSDDAHPFADYFHSPPLLTPPRTPVKAITQTPLSMRKSFKTSTRTPSKAKTARSYVVAGNESDSIPDNVWHTPSKVSVVEPAAVATPKTAPSDMPSAYAFDRDNWARRNTQMPQKSGSPASETADRRAFKKYIETKYGSKVEQVYNDPCTIDLQLETLKGLQNAADDSTMESLVGTNEEGLNDIDGSLEDRASIQERSMLSLQLAMELLKSMPEETIPSPPPSPKPVSQLPLVAPLAEEEYASLSQLARNLGMTPAAEVVKLPSTTLTSHDFGTLLPRMFNGDAKGWLNDNIINEYLEILVKHAQQKEGYVYVRGKGGLTPPVHAFKSQWYTSMKGNPTGTARWARPMHLFGEKLLSCNLVLIPICHHSHWRLIAIKPKDRKIEYYDSLHGLGGEFTQLAMDWVREVLQKQFVEAEWSICTEQRSEEQANASDCGIFTLLNALVLLRGEEHNRVSVTNGMDDARLRVAATLLAKTATTEMD